MRPKNSYLLGVGSPPFLAVADCNRWEKKKKKKKKKTPFTIELPLRVLPLPNQNTNRKIAFWLLYFLRLFVFSFYQRYP